MNIPLVDLKAQYSSIKDEINSATQSVFESAQFILGPEVKTLEEELAQYCGVKYGVGVASGTDALHLALLASGIKPGDEVITTPFTFIATAESIAKCGATPVFVDIDLKTYNIDPRNIEPKINQRTRAILPVHLYGQPADMYSILELARKYNLRIIEDCAQALGAEYNGRKVGSLGDAGCLSFFPAKNLGAYGDGGMVVTNNLEIAEKVEMLRNHGCKEKYYHLLPGFNSRLDTLQAAILRVKLRHLDEWLKLRLEKASAYAQFLGGIEELELPHMESHNRHVFNYYTIRLRNSLKRDKMQKYLNSQGIATAIYYPLSLHLQEVFKSPCYKLGDFTESERAQEEVLSLPMYPELSEEQIGEIAKAIKTQIQTEK
ncbi:DegT/DnrJ/EryC1/StrS family aminotransferase [Chloroflexota bacterium]